MQNNATIKKVNFSITTLLDQFKDEPYFVFLDSAKKQHISIMAWDPYATLSMNTHKQISLYLKDDIQRPISNNPFDMITELITQCPNNKLEVDSPFNGGAIGLISYDARSVPAELPQASKKTTEPILDFGFYNQFIVINHQDNTMHWVHIYLGKLAAVPDILTIKANTHSNNEKLRVSELASNHSKDSFTDIVKKAQHHIKEGNIYQVNLSHRFEASYTGHPIDIYKSLRKTSPAPYAAYMKTDSHHILSSSPEQFFQINGGLIQTRPIKGTIAKGKTSSEDEKNKKALQSSSKEKAELLMITDLLRNDIGKICETGSVKVPDLHRLENYSHVHHLVATIQGTLKKNTSMKDIIHAMFPGGSITGAPKYRAMEIIAELEIENRGYYTGTLGYWSCNNNADFNILIRSIFCNKDRLRFDVGSGITASSDPNAEWEETLAKAEGMIESFTKKEARNV